MTLLQAVCEICFNTCQIPVQIICFPCWDPNHKNCHSIKRFCMSCADKYLEFHYPEHLRSRTKKCIYCEEYVDLMTINKNCCYQVDFLTMSYDTSIISCVNNDCAYKGSQNDILRHLETCGFSMKRCKGCNQEVRLNDMNKHLDQCPHYVKCHLCGLFCLRDGEYDLHLFNCHNLAQCMYCMNVISSELLSKHSHDECEHRPVECSGCHLIISKKEEQIHLIRHLQDTQKKRVDMMVDSSRYTITLNFNSSC
jgi:hypothetical protein